MSETLTAHETFAQDVGKGLSASPKRLPSKYFYNERGDELFQQIMGLEEYYLTRAEYAIFNTHQEALRRHCSPQGEAFRLVEFGAGDGYKTKVLLKHLLEQGSNFTYQPIDISQNVLDQLEGTLSEELPRCTVEPICADYFEALATMEGDTRKMVLFLGSNIGNFKEDQARSFLQQLSDNLQAGDRVLIGFDQRKDPARILAAYNDAQGITREFNMNLLDRMNEELDANFDRKQFKHWPVYNPGNGECKSYLLSTCDQEVRIGALDQVFHFQAWEAIYMEMSRKFSREQIEAMAQATGYRVLEHLTDPKGDFVDSVWERL